MLASQAVSAYYEYFQQHLTMQTVVGLHYLSEAAHLNISTRSVIVQYDETQAWDQLRLVDFGFCQSSAVGKHDITGFMCTAA